MQITVSMSLERFKELESAEIALQLISSDTKYFVYKTFHSVWIVDAENRAAIDLLRERNEAIDQRENTLSKVRKYESETGKKVL